MKNLFKGLKKGLEEVLAHTEGKITLKSEFIDIPNPPCEYKPEEIKKIRESCNYSQGIFAKILNVSIKTVQAWESGARIPSHAALRLLEIIDKGFYRPEIYRKSA
jgi:Predicted transcriptional regulator